MSLAFIFLSHVPEARRERFAAVPELEAKLAHLVTAAREAWPELPLLEGDFLAFLGRCLPEEAADALDALHVDDLFLVHAYGRGVPGAYEALERRCMVRVTAALARARIPAPVIADIVQDLRRRLVEMQHPRPEQKLYAGRGDLVGWLRVSAMREANLRRERRARELPLEVAGEPLAEHEDAEVALLAKLYKPELTRAFQEAVAALSVEDRNLLRYHFLDRLSIDRIGSLFGVHRVTASRRINRAREALCAQTLELFQRRVSLSTEGVHRLLGLLESQVGAQLAAVPP